MVALDVIVVVVVALLAFLVAGLLRSNAEITRGLHSLGVDLGPGAEAHDHDGVTTPVELSARPTPARPSATDLADPAGVTPGGEAISIAVSGVRHDTLLAFLSSGCQTCRVIWEAFRDGVDGVPGNARVIAVTRGQEGESPSAVANLSGDKVPVVMSTETWQHYDIPYAPYFVYVSGEEERVIGEGVASSWDQVKGLLENAVGDRNNPAPTIDVERQWEIARGDAERADRIDRELSAAGIRPGDPRLHHQSTLHVEGPPAPDATEE